MNLYIWYIYILVIDINGKKKLIIYDMVGVVV